MCRCICVSKIKNNVSLNQFFYLLFNPKHITSTSPLKGGKKMQKCKNAKMQKCKNAKMQNKIKTLFIFRIYYYFLIIIIINESNFQVTHRI